MSVALALLVLLHHLINCSHSSEVKGSAMTIDPFEECTKISTTLFCTSTNITNVLPTLIRQDWFDKLIVTDNQTELTLPWQSFARSTPLNTLDLSQANLACACENIWLAYWDSMLKPIAPVESLTLKKDVLLWFLADVSRVCGNDCPKTIRDIYGLPQKIVLPDNAWEHCSTTTASEFDQSDLMVKSYFSENCGISSLNLSAKQVIFSNQKKDDVVVCNVINDTAYIGTKKQCPTFKITTFLEKPLKPDIFTWCMNEDTAVLSVNNVKPNSSGWIICFGNGFLPQASAIPLLVITLPVFTHFNSVRVNAKELHIKFQLHSYPNVNLRLYIWEAERKGWREVSLDEEYVSQKGRRGAVWFSRAIHALASTTTEGEVQFTDMDTVCRVDRYNFTACNSIGCAWQTFELKPDDENVLCAANADSPSIANSATRKQFEFFSKPKVILSNSKSLSSAETTSDDSNDASIILTGVFVPFILVTVLLILTTMAVVYRQYKSAKGISILHNSRVTIVPSVGTEITVETNQLMPSQETSLS